MVPPPSQGDSPYKMTMLVAGLRPRGSFGGVSEGEADSWCLMEACVGYSL